VRGVDLNPLMLLHTLMGVTMLFGKYVYVLLFVLLMRRCEILLRMGM